MPWSSNGIAAHAVGAAAASSIGRGPIAETGSSCPPRLGGAIGSIAFSNDGKTLAWARYDGQIRLIDEEDFDDIAIEGDESVREFKVAREVPGAPGGALFY